MKRRTGEGRPGETGEESAGGGRGWPGQSEEGRGGGKEARAWPPAEAWAADRSGEQSVSQQWRADNTNLERELSVPVSSVRCVCPRDEGWASRDGVVCVRGRPDKQSRTRELGKAGQLHCCGPGPGRFAISAFGLKRRRRRLPPPSSPFLSQQPAVLGEGKSTGQSLYKRDDMRRPSQRDEGGEKRRAGGRCASKGAQGTFDRSAYQGRARRRLGRKEKCRRL